MVDVLNAGNARSFISEVRFPKHIVSGTFDGRSRVSNLAKDLTMAAEFAQELGQPSAYAPLTAEILARAMEQGLSEQDFTLLYKDYDKIAG
jgi:3-hydroxyisobutyrate dehydrogenase